MNIKEAKDEIKRSVESYLDKNEFGEYTIPLSKQRPVFMTGAPGIGKTAVIQQIATELDIAFISCSMTHHTRQSALGRPVIKEREFGGQKTAVSEYTISDIIAEIYHVMRDSGKKEGILFLNEINCVPETLMPAILLFLQHKSFGNRRIPEGWVVVAAGSLPEYNPSAKRFDVETLDRLRQINITEDFSVWKQYASRQGLHAAVLTFLEMNPQCFYFFHSSTDGVQYVTARGWEDLSTAIRLYEKKGFQAASRLITQYITDAEIAGKFGNYYELFQKCRSDYQIMDILAGKISPETAERAREADTGERYSVLGLLMEELNVRLRKVIIREHCLGMVVEALQDIKRIIEEKPVSVSVLLYGQAERLKKQLKKREAANNITEEERKEYLAAVQMLTEYMEHADIFSEDVKREFEKVKRQFGKEMRQHKKTVMEVQGMSEAALQFTREVWDDNQLLVIQDLAFPIIFKRSLCEK